MTIASPDRTLRTVWLGSLAAFTLAIATGVFFRFAAAYGFTFGLNLANVRHAHSHLMFFAWVTPALMVLISKRMVQLSGRPVPGLSINSARAALILGFLAWLPFLFFGYKPIQGSGFPVPPSVVLAGLNMLAWYGFAWGYRMQRRSAPHADCLLFLDAAVLFLVLSTFGAWGISTLVPLGIHDGFWPAALPRLFLDLFSEGWLLFAVIGLMLADEASTFPSIDVARRVRALIVIGVGAAFILSMPRNMLNEYVRDLALVCSTLMALGLIVLLRFAWGMNTIPWRMPLGFAAFKAAAFLLIIATPVFWWSAHFGERILYLHIHLLGLVSLGILAAADRELIPISGHRYVRWVEGSVVILVLSLIPSTLFMPDAWRGVWIVHALAWAALPALTTVAGLTWYLYRKARVGNRDTTPNVPLFTNSGSE